MPTWLDENTIQGEMSQEEFLKKVNEEITARVEKEEKESHPGNYGNDGLITIYEETKQHADITYKLKVLRYFAVRRLPHGHFEFQPGRGMNKIGKHVVVEHDGAELPYELKDLLGLSEFLYLDTLHSGQEDWTLKQQWEHADNVAKCDCERVLHLETAFNHKVEELRRELRDWLKQLIKQ